MSQPHIPVLLTEVLAAMAPTDDDIHVDGTFGAGGYSRAILSAARTRVVAIDRDPSASVRGRAMETEFAPRFTFLEGCFGSLDHLLTDASIYKVDGVVLDIGVSSMQIDQAERGFSFSKDGPLDMRMGAQGPTAADLVNEMPEDQLADVIYQFGEERYARRVARSIVEARKTEPFSRTLQLAETVRRAVPRSNDGIDPATRTFQGLRIAVNDELGELSRGLAAAERMLAPGGRLAVVTFHSLEDRVVKEFLKERGQAPSRPSRHLPDGPNQLFTPTFAGLTKKPVTAQTAEIAANPRARSARLRSAVRTSAPAPQSSGDRP